MPSGVRAITCCAARSSARRSRATSSTTCASPRSRTPTIRSRRSTIAYSDDDTPCLPPHLALQSIHPGMSTWLVALVLLPIALVLVLGLVSLLARPLVVPAFAALERARFQRCLARAARGDAHLQERQIEP